MRLIVFAALLLLAGCSPRPEGCRCSTAPGGVKVDIRIGKGVDVKVNRAGCGCWRDCTCATGCACRPNDKCSTSCDCPRK